MSSNTLKFMMFLGFPLIFFLVLAYSLQDLRVNLSVQLDAARGSSRARMAPTVQPADTTLVTTDGEVIHH